MDTKTERVALKEAFEYVDQPVNWGRDDYEVRASAQDGFVSGFEAGLAYAKKVAA